MVLQTPRPFETMTVRENAVSGQCSAADGSANASGASGRRDARLRRAGDRRDEPVGSLNLHEQRFLEIARQLAGRPRLVLLDEVMAGLNDTELASSIEMVRRARAEFGVTVIWVEHVMKAVMSLAERVLVLNFGQLIADGAPGDVMRFPEVVDRLPRREAGRSVNRGDDARCDPAGPAAVRRVRRRDRRARHQLRGRRGRGGRRDRIERRRQVDAVPRDRGCSCAIAGTRLVRRRDISKLGTHRVTRLGLAYVPAERHLFPQMTVAENLCLGAFPGRPRPDAGGRCSTSSRASPSAAGSRQER